MPPAPDGVPGFRKAAKLVAASAEPVAVVLPVGVNGICFARALARAGIRVVGLARDIREPTSRTRRCAVVQCPSRAERAMELLAALGRVARVKPVLLTVADVETLLISEHRHYLQAWYHLVLPPHAVLELLVDKLRFSDWAVQQGLPIAGTWCARSTSQILDVALRARYPCILKPRYRDRLWGSLGLPKGFKLANAQALRACYRFVSQWQPEVVVSEWVEGPDSNVYSGHIYVPRPGTDPVVVLTRKLRQYPPQIGNGSLVVAWHDRTLSSMTADVYSRLEYRGFGGVEMKIDERDLRPRIIEPMAGRLSMIWYPALIQGINLSYVAYCDALARPLPSLQRRPGPAKWIDELPDLASALRYLRSGELTVGDYLRSLRGPKVCVHLDWRDPLPGLFLALDAARLVAGKAARRLFGGGRSPACAPGSRSEVLV